ncbi:hypothetical protein BC834DRAFT_794278, partial [Gloeopeniophorella convolvens]
VRFEVHGDPVDAKFCHCTVCQVLHGASFQWAVIFPKMTRSHTSFRLVRDEKSGLHFFSAEKGCTLVRVLIVVPDPTGAHHLPVKVSCNARRAPLFDEGRGMVLACPRAFYFSPGSVPDDFFPSCHTY